MRIEPPEAQGALQRAWAAFRSWPRWAQITAWVALVFVVLAAFGDESNERNVATGPASDADPAEEVSQVTTTTLRPTTTRPPSTTTVPTTTTVAPITTAAPSTIPPVVAPPPPAAPPPAEEADGCHPSYEGACLPFASDVDCAGGSGNGPEYTAAKNIRVVGPDAYDLDRDGNGLGCEP